MKKLVLLLGIILYLVSCKVEEPKFANQSTFLEAETTTIELTEEDIRIWSTTGPGVLAIYFWAPWHGPSRMYASRFEKVAEWYTNEECYFGKINFEDIDQQIRTKYGVNEMPTTFIIKQNEIVAKAVGIIEESTLKALVNQYKATATKRTSPD